jgi:hypothetical protein
VHISIIEITEYSQAASIRWVGVWHDVHVVEQWPTTLSKQQGQSRAEARSIFCFPIYDKKWPASYWHHLGALIRARLRCLSKYGKFGFVTGRFLLKHLDASGPVAFRELAPIEAQRIILVLLSATRKIPRAAYSSILTPALHR